jgi:plasmid replication initiation protein
MLKNLFLIFFSLQNLSAQDQVSSVQLEAVDPQIKSLEWNRYTSKNFTILSIDNQKGKDLSETIESLKTSVLTRWGFPDVKFNKECRGVVVPDYDLLKNLFNLNVGKVQLRKELNVIWCVGDDKPNKSILPYLTQVCMYEYEVVESTTLPVWFKRGCIILNGSVVDVRQSLKSFNDIARKEQFTNSADQIFTTSEDDYNKQTNENKKIFDQQAACLCLMLRKEFGAVKLQGFLRLQSKNNPETVLGMIYGFKSYSQFDRQYVRYMKDLCADLADDHTPDSYLEIKSVR